MEQKGQGEVLRGTGERSEGQENEWKYEAEGCWEWVKYLGSPRALGWGRLTRVNAADPS